MIYAAGLVVEDADLLNLFRQFAELRYVTM
jgi:hypothetical protein